MTNCYQVLGVSENATAEILKIAYEGRLKALAKARMGEAERKAEEALLRQAYGTLTNPARRAAHDAQLEGAVEREARSSRNTTIAVAAGLAVVLLGGIAWYFSDRSARAERIRLEEARIAREADDLRRQVEADKMAKERRDRDAAYAQDAAYRKEAEDRRRVERERSNYNREVERAQAAVDREAAYQSRQEQQKASERERAEMRDRMQSERDLAAAKRDVDRQKRYLETQEREEQRAREERHHRATRDAEAARERDAARERSEREAELARQREEDYRRRQVQQQTYAPATKR